MKTQIIEGTAQQIAKKLIELNGQIIHAVLLIEEPSDHKVAKPGEDIFAEMEPYTVKAGGADYSRESLYTPLEGE